MGISQSYKEATVISLIFLYYLIQTFIIASSDARSLSELIKCGKQTIHLVKHTTTKAGYLALVLALKA